MLKKKDVTLILLFTFFIFLAVFWHLRWQAASDLILMSSGETIVADESWTIGGAVVYLQGRDTGMALRAEVTGIEHGNPPLLRTGKLWFDAQLRFFSDRILHLARRHGFEQTVTPTMLADYLLNTLPWLWGLFGILLLVRVFFSGSRRPRHVVVATEDASLEDAAGTPTRLPKASNLEEQIVVFFLNLYRIQLRAPEQAAVAFEPVSTSVSSKNRIYELSVRKGNDWVTRRMTLGPIGEESGAKSTVYYVIFDVHLVVKIPARPITDFAMYLEAINKDMAIVEKLAPRECIIPRVSVIMKQIRQFHDAEKMSPEEIESRYIRWLSNSAEAQKYLKIGDSFVFFMDLSQYVFLGHIVADLHDLEKKVVAEILGNPTLIWDTDGFSGRYGKDYSDICFELQDLFRRCETGVKQHVVPDADAEGIPGYLIREGYLTRLAEREVVPQERKIDAATAEILNTQIDAEIDHCLETVNRYRGIVRGYVREVVFSQNRKQLSAIIINLLDLLHWIGDRQVALRDLKPDNLLVAGDKSEYPDFLKYPDRFSIGLIDVETAVYFGSDGNSGVKQPQLGGTPFYATPTHLLQNSWIEEIYGDLPLILHLQDWQATMAIIYKLVFGEPLFELTGRLLPGLRKTIQKRVNLKEEPTVVIRDVSRLFWSSAKKEFHTKIRQNGHRLDEIFLNVTPPVVGMLSNGLDRAAHATECSIIDGVDAQSYFPGEKNRRQLLQGNSDQLTKLLKRFKHQIAEGKITDQRGEVLTRWLIDLADLKRRSEQIQSNGSRLRSQPEGVTVLQVMTILFDIVFALMTRPIWKPTIPVEPVPAAPAHGETTYEVTIESENIDVEPARTA